MLEQQLQDTVYETESGDEGWVEGIARWLIASFELDFGVHVTLNRGSDYVVVGEDLPFDPADLTALLRREDVWVGLEFGTRPRPTVATGQHLGMGRADLVELFWDFLTSHGVSDFLFVAASAAGREMTVFVPKRRPVKIDDDTFMRWYRLAVHLSAAMRLRMEHGAELDTDRTQDVWQRLLEGKLRLTERFHAGDRRVLVLRETAPGRVASRALGVREKQVARLAGRGLANKEIAHELGLSVSTVATHLRRALAKLDFESRVELVQHAARLSTQGSHAVATPSPLDDDELENTERLMRELELELLKLVRGGPVAMMGDAHRARMRELRQSLQAMQRLLASIGA